MEAVREQLLILWTTPFYVLIILGEILLSHYKHSRNYTLRDVLNNFLMMLLNGGIDLLFRAFYLVVLIHCWNHRITEISTPWIYWLTLLLAEDFLFYWLHRFDHVIRMFWVVHVTHHSSDKMNLTVGFRSSVFQPLYRFLYFIPLGFLGFQPMDILFMYAITQIWGILVHTEHVGKLGWLEYILVTPSHHRVHHASNVLYLDKNMGMFLIIWDRMFGTFQEELNKEDYEAIKYGLTSPLEIQRPDHIVFHEWRSMFSDLFRNDLSWKQRLGYLFGPPGWSHDGSRKTAEELRRLRLPHFQKPLHHPENDRTKTAVLQRDLRSFE